MCPGSDPQAQEPPPGSPIQLSPLRPLTTHITVHDVTTANPSFHTSPPAQWKHISTGQLAFRHIYSTTQTPPSLSQNLDIVQNSRLATSNLLVIPGGSSSRVVDFAPGYETVQHRTQSLDYGVVVEGEVELLLEGGETRRMGVGDTVVQRGTMHAWRNVRTDVWARMFFVLLSCHPVEINGEVLVEDSGGL